MLVVIPNSFSPLPYSAHCQNRATETTNVSTLLLAQFAHTTINALFKVTRARTGYSAAEDKSYYYHKYECSTTTKIFLVSDNVNFSFSLPAVSTPACSLPVMCKTFRAIPELSRLQILIYIYSPYEFSALGYQRAAANLECHVLYGILISTKRKEG